MLGLSSLFLTRIFEKGKKMKMNSRTNLNIHTRVGKRSTLFFLFLCFFLSTQLFAKPVSVEQVRKAADTFLKTHRIQQEKGVKRLTMRAAQQALPMESTIASVKEIYGDDGKVLAYVTELVPEGFIITAADTDIRPILGYSFKGKFPFKDSKQNVLLHLVQWDVAARLRVLSTDTVGVKTLSQSNNQSWDTYVSANDQFAYTLAGESQTQWPDPSEYEHEGWIKTKWDQGYYFDENNQFQQSHYNDKCPEIPNLASYRCRVGCVATAMAQIINYWKYPSSIKFEDKSWWLGGDSYTSKGDDGNIEIDNDAVLYNFPTFDELNTQLMTVDYNADANEEAYLCFAAGIKVGMDYGKTSSSFTYKCGGALRNDFDYGSANRKITNWNMLIKGKAIESIKKGWPLQIGINRLFYKQGHSVIVDGYKDSGEFHLNMGWHGAGDFWYFLPIIDTTEAPDPGDYYFNIVTQVVYDICPYQGWSQWGADEKNSFSTIYTAPTAENEPITNKWYVTSDSVYTFSGLVVGTGNKIYASSKPDTEGYHPSIWVINQYGE